jgi:hypothetical protein
VKDVVEVVPPPENGNGNGEENDKNGTAAQISDFEEEGGPGVPENGENGEMVRRRTTRWTGSTSA